MQQRCSWRSGAAGPSAPPASSESRRCLRRPGPLPGGRARARRAPARRRDGRCGRGRARPGGSRPALAPHRPPRASSFVRLRRTASRRRRPRSGRRCSAGWPWTTHTPSATSSASPAASRLVEPGLGVEGADHALLRRRVLAAASCRSVRANGHAVAERVVALDQPVTHREQVEALELERVAGGRDPAEVPGPGEGPASVATATPQRSLLGGRRDDLHVEVGNGRDQLADEIAHALGCAARRPARGRYSRPPARPQRHRRVEVSCASIASK